MLDRRVAWGLLVGFALSGCKGQLEGQLLSPEAFDATPPTSAPDSSAATDAGFDAAVAPDAPGRVDAGFPEADASTAFDAQGDPDAAKAFADAAEPTDLGLADSGAVTVPIFVAQGLVGRTTISCDDGRTWGADRAWDTEGDAHLCGVAQPVTCYQTGAQCSYVGYDGACSHSNDCDCLHSPAFSKGVVYGAGVFVGTWGWGLPGSVRVSRDGVHWAETLPNDQFGGLAYGGGRFVLSSRTPQYSADGTHWSAGGEADFRDGLGSGDIIWSVRRFAYADVLGGRFLAVASGNTDRDMLISSDGGVSWWRPSLIPANCAGDVSVYGGILSGNGTIVIVDQEARACRSTDGGQTWTVTRIANTAIYSHGVFTGTEFWFWGDDGNRYASADGQTWTATRMRTPQRLGPVARSEGGTLVAISNVWDGYGQQRMLRSVDDGLTWDVLTAGQFGRGHPIFYLSFGQAEPSEFCPAPR